MAITGIYTKDFPDLGRDAGESDLIPIAEVGNIVTKKTPVSGLITSARVVGALGFTPYGATPGTVGKLAMFGTTDLQDSLLSQTGNQINLGTYAAFGVNNPGTPGDPGVDNDAWIGSIINNDFLVKINNVEALRIDTALSLKIANIPKATTDTDKFLVSDGGVVKYRTGSELLSDIGAYNATNPAGYISGITSGMVTTALGFTPYDATNPAGYTSNLGTVTSVSGTGSVSGLTLSGTVTTSGSLTLGGTLSLTSGQVTTALGFTPYDSTNPAGYITSAALSGYLPLTGGTLASSGSANTLNINHTSGSGIALNILKNGNGEALTIVKGSGSGNAASITGGITLLSELNLTTKLADAHIASAATWNAKQNALNGTGFVKISGTTISYDNSSYALASALSGYLPLSGGTLTGALGGTSATFSGNALFGGSTALTGIGGGISINHASASGVQFKISDVSKGWIYVTNANKLVLDAAASVGIEMYVNASYSTPALSIASTGSATFSNNVGIGTTTDAGFKLDVNGTGRFSGSGLFANRLAIGGGFIADNSISGNDVGIGFAPSTIFPVDGNGSYSVRNLGSSTFPFGSATFSNSVTATSLIKSGGTSSQFLKADGSVDSSAYITGLSWAGLTGKPTTISGFGITDAVSNVQGVQGAWTGTQAAYDAIATKSSTTIYFIQ